VVTLIEEDVEESSCRAVGGYLQQHQPGHQRNQTARERVSFLALLLLRRLRPAITNS
jgi:hypothetical protein